MAAFLVLVLIILVELFSGTDGGDSSHQSPKVASAPPAAPVVGEQPQFFFEPQDDRSQRAKEQAPGDSHSSSGVPPRSAAQPGDAGGRAPEVTPRPKPPPAPPEIPAPSQPPVSESPSEPVQTTDTVANNNGPVGGP
jgi:hypothetical protein